MQNQQTSNPFRFLLRVRYCECDAQSVVFNARYGDYIDTAVTEYFRVIFGSYQAILDQGLDFQVVKLTTEWKSPARYDEVLELSVETAHVGNSSFTFIVVFREQASQRLVATSEIVYVMVNTDNFTKAAIPASLKDPLKNGAPDILINQAGNY